MRFRCCRRAKWDKSAPWFRAWSAVGHLRDHGRLHGDSSEWAGPPSDSAQNNQSPGPDACLPRTARGFSQVSTHGIRKSGSCHRTQLEVVATRRPTRRLSVLQPTSKLPARSTRPLPMPQRTPERPPHAATAATPSKSRTGLTVPQKVLPPRTLADAEPAPLVLLREPVCREVLDERFGQDHVSVLERVVWWSGAGRGRDGENKWARGKATGRIRGVREKGTERGKMSASGLWSGWSRETAACIARRARRSIGRARRHNREAPAVAAVHGLAHPSCAPASSYLPHYSSHRSRSALRRCAGRSPRPFWPSTGGGVG